MTLLETITQPSRKQSRKIIGDVIAMNLDGAVVGPSGVIRAVRDFVMTLPEPCATVALDELAARLEEWEREK